MKKTIAILVIALATAGLSFAQTSSPAPGNQGQNTGPGYGRVMGGFPGGQFAQAQKTTIEGKLVFIDDSPALQTKDKTYIINMPRFYYYAYTDNIREGAQMKLEGYVLPTFPGQDKPFFLVRTATVGAKTYDLSAGAARFFGRMGGRRGVPGGPQGGMMGGYGPQGGGW